MLIYIVWAIATLCLVLPTRLFEEWVQVAEAMLLAISVSFGTSYTLKNKTPEYWESSKTRGFDEAYRKVEKLLEYEKEAIYEAGWKVSDEYDPYTGPNFNMMMISSAIVTLVCFSFFALILLV
jgi:hypothetical protein